MSTAPVSQASASQPAQVANSFVLKYYTLLGEKPQALYHFYKENSVFTHGHEDSNAGIEEETVHGKENIGKKLQALDYQEAKVTLSVVDSQGTEDGGVMITVIGHLTTKRDPSPRKFIQTFILAVQKEPRGFYIRNDIYRFLKHNDAAIFDQPAAPATGQEKQAPVEQAHPQPVVEQKVEPTHQPVAPQPQQSTPAPQQSAPKEPETPKEAPVQTPKPEPEAQKPTTPEKKEQPVQEKAPEKPVQPVQEKKEDKKEEKTDQPAEKKPQPEKKQKQPKQPNDKPKKQEEKKPEKPEKPAVPSWANVIVSGPGVNPPPQVILQMQKEKEEEKKQEKKPEKKFKDDQGNTVWVSNLPFTISEDKVRAAFAKFGEITRIDLHAQKGFGFVEYASLDMVKQAIEKCKATPLYLEGRPIQVEQRKKEKRPRTDRDQFVDKKDNKDRVKQENGKPPKPARDGQQPQQSQRPPKPQNDNPKPKKQTESNGQQGRPQKNL